jgi:hypothetical protein
MTFTCRSPVGFEELMNLIQYLIADFSASARTQTAKKRIVVDIGAHRWHRQDPRPGFPAACGHKDSKQY